MFIKLLFIAWYLCDNSTFITCHSCVTPPMKCPNGNITFWLYTRRNKYKPHQISVNDSESIRNAPWVKDAPIKILIHGYTGHKDFSPNTEIRPAYMKCCKYNIISVDYNPLVREPCYIQSVQNSELVGKCIAQLIDELVAKYRFPLKQFHVIGYSLGGHVTGFIGNYLTTGKLPRISALDPAMPMFITVNVTMKLDKRDAQFVDVLHTNAMQRGKFMASGHVDFYANGGISQPGCKSTEDLSKSSCSHARAPLYFAESINTVLGFYAKKCQSWTMYIMGLCDTFQPSILFGEYVPLNAEGSYFFSTNENPPYARAPIKSINYLDLFCYSLFLLFNLPLEICLIIRYVV